MELFPLHLKSIGTLQKQGQETCGQPMFLFTWLQAHLHIFLSFMTFEAIQVNVPISKHFFFLI
jgi:hypothetical protein